MAWLPPRGAMARQVGLRSADFSRVELQRAGTPAVGTVLWTGVGLPVPQVPYQCCHSGSKGSAPVSNPS